jgi:hypothetical protein
MDTTARGGCFNRDCVRGHRGQTKARAAVLTPAGEVLEETQRLRAETEGGQAAEIVNATLQDAAKRFAPLLVVKGVEDWAKR